MPFNHRPDSWPAYSYVPGMWPHPIRDKDGHSFGVEAPILPAPSANDWHDCACYLQGIELFNRGYYWEAHEAWEAVWHACHREGPIADLLKGLIKLAAAGVKIREGSSNGASRHARRAVELFEQSARECSPGELLGLKFDDLCELAGAIENAANELTQQHGGIREPVRRIELFRLQLTKGEN